MSQLRVLLVPDWLQWVTGTMAKDIARWNSGVCTTILSGPVLYRLALHDRSLIERFDLVHFLCPYASGDWLPIIRNRVPVVTSHFHVTDWPEISHNLDGDAIVAISTEWVRDLEKRGARMERVIMIPPGVDTEIFKPASAPAREDKKEQLGLSADAPVIGFFAKRGSNDRDRKGTDIFVEAAIELNRKIAGVQYLIVGPGWARIVEQLAATGVKCRWIPFAETQEEVAALYTALDFYWVTSRVEGGPVPLLEAMSCGVTCLSTRVGCAIDLLVDGVNGLVLPFDDPKAFANVTHRLWYNTDLRKAIGGQARQTITTNVEGRRVAQQYGDAYKLAIANFARRHDEYHPAEAEAISWAGNNEKLGVRSEDVLRNSLTGRESRRAAMLEQLLWAEHLAREPEQRNLALRRMLRTAVRYPGASDPLSMLMRHALPSPLIRAAGSVKRAILGARSQHPTMRE